MSLLVCIYMSEMISKMKDVERASIRCLFECSGSLGVIFLHFKVKISGK